MIYFESIFTKSYFNLTKKINSNKFILILILINKIIICKCNLVSPVQYNFQLCSVGLRIFIDSVQPFNKTGFSLNIFDPFELQHYQINISYLEHNWLPNYSESKFRLIDKPKKLNFQLNVDKKYSIDKFFSYELIFKDYFYFVKTPNSELVYLLGYTNDLIGCPQNLCLNAYLDAIFYHKIEKEFYFFRGYYFYKTNKNKIDQYDFDLIENNFLGVPSYLNAATYFPTNKLKSGYFIIFVKENSIFIYTEEQGIAFEVDKKEFLRSKNNFSTENSFIKAMTYYPDEFLFVRFESNFAFYKINFDKDIKTLYFEQDGPFFSVITKENFIENSENIIFKNDKAYFFKKWKIYEYDLQKLKEDNFAKYEKADSVLFYDFFKCPNIYPKYFKIEEQTFRKVYLSTLPEPHNPNTWISLISSKLPYDPALIYMVTGMTISFLIISYLFFAFFIAFYCIITKEKSNNNVVSNISEISRSSIASQQISEPVYESKSKKSFLKYSKASTPPSNFKKTLSSKKSKSTK